MSKTAKQQQATERLTKRLTKRLIFATFAMFAFGFALVPLYDVICEVTGLNGKTAGRYQSNGTDDVTKAQVDKSRLVTVQFLANNNDGMAWEFRPNVSKVVVHPGEITVVSFHAKNPSTVDMVAQAVPSVAPYGAAQYMHKIECFCFKQQKLAAGQEVDMPLRFFIDEALPQDLTKLTLSYSLFNVTPNVGPVNK